MKRGSGLYAILVALVAFSIFSTGLYANFLDTFTGNSFSLITGMQFGIDLPKTPSLPSIKLPSLKGPGETCVNNVDCFSGYCESRAGRDKKCRASIEGESCFFNKNCLSGICNSQKKCDSRTVTTGLKNGEKCTQDSQCLQKKCSKKQGSVAGICGLANGGACQTGNPCFSISCENRKCAKSPLGLFCVADGNCRNGSKCINNACRECMKNTDCSARQYCNKAGNCVGINSRINEFCKDAKTCSCSQDSECEGLKEKCVAYSSLSLTPICTSRAQGASCKPKICAECFGNVCVAPGTELPAAGDCSGPDCTSEGDREENERLNKWKLAIEKALSLFKTRLTQVEKQHQSQATGRSITGFQIFAPKNLVGVESGPKLEQPIGAIGGVAVPERVPSTIEEWKTALKALDNTSQLVEDRICSESFKHPEIETEGLPCTISGGPLETPQPLSGGLEPKLPAPVLPGVGI